MSRALGLSAIVFVLFGCDAREEACGHEGCGSYHHTTYDNRGNTTAEGSIELTKPDARRLDASAGLTLAVHDNGTLDLTDKEGVRAHVALVLPSSDDDYSLDEVDAELWYCASAARRILPVASRDGSIVPGCFENGQDFVPAVRERLEGSLTVFDPPASLDDLRTEESGYAFHYRIDTRADAATRVTLDVSSWNKKKIADCGDFY